MKRVVFSRPGAVLTKSAPGLLTTISIAGVPAPAIEMVVEGEAQTKTMLKAMADYVSRQKSLSVKYDADVGVVTPAFEKIQFSASGDITMRCPNKFRVSRTGGYADAELISDGSNVTVYDRGGNRDYRVTSASSSNGARPKNNPFYNPPL
jgi:hypothetical protein